MRVNTGIPYEILVESIFREILGQDEVRTIKAQRNVKLQGKSAVHQIDVYWKFAVGDITHQTIVQARDYESRIKQEAVFAFNCVLNDIPGQPRGVMVTRTGFQSGAQTYAKYHGIKLFLLKPWQRHYTMSDVSYADYWIDQQLVWHVTVYREEVQVYFRVAPSPSGPKNIPKDSPRQYSKMYLLNADGKTVGTIAEIIRGFIAGMRDAGALSATFKHDFSEPTYFRFSRRSARLTHLTAIEAGIKLVPEPQPPVPLLPPGVVQFVLEDLDDGTRKFFPRHIKEGRKV